MGDNRFSCSGGAAAARGETFGIETSRILDACRDRDCFEDVRVYLTALGEEMIARTNNVRVKCAKISGSYIATEPVQFNRGFYSVMIRFYLTVTLEVCVPMGQAQELEGIAVVEKRVVLYGGESNVNVFRSSESGSFCAIPEPVTCKRNDPEAVVEVLEPIVLGARIVEHEQDCHCCCCCCDIPVQITDCLNGTLVNGDEGNGDGRYLALSIGLFSVVRLVRPGQFMIQATEFCLPDKECVAPSEDNPCCAFRKMPFPTAEFCPNTAPVSLIGNGGKGSRCCGNS